MDVVLAGLDQHALPYIDDILIFSSSWEDHLIHMEGVMGRLKEARLTVKPGKCLWGRKQLEYLGHLVGDGQVAVPDARVEAVKQYKRPRTAKEMRSFLGLMGYYRRFIPHYADIARPLHMATHKEAPSAVEWTEERLSSFCKLCNVLCDVCVLPRVYNKRGECRTPNITNGKCIRKVT